jgi:uncharacterized membrane protein
MITLIIVAISVYFGLAQRILDKMRLSDRAAIVFLLAMAAGSFIDIPLYSGRINLAVNVGGGLLPFILAVWLIVTADTAKEKLRANLAMAGVAAMIYLGTSFLPSEPETMLIDPKLLYGALSGIVAYLLGRSRRAAFAGGVLGVILSDVIHTIMLFSRGLVGTTMVGGAGAFDVIVMTGFIAVIVAELIGEANEKIARFRLGRGKHRLRHALLESSEELGISREKVKRGKIVPLPKRQEGKHE